MSEEEMTQLELKRNLKYDHDTGLFIRRISTRSRANAGDIAGSVTNTGYICIRVNGKKHLAHRLAFLYVCGAFPKYVDHINHNRIDNRWNNLRSVNRTENQRNSSKNKNNTSGVSGVFFDKRSKMWIAQIGVNSKHVYLGRNKSKEVAITIRKGGEGWYGYHKNHGAMK